MVDNLRLHSIYQLRMNMWVLAHPPQWCKQTQKTLIMGVKAPGKRKATLPLRLSHQLGLGRICLSLPMGYFACTSPA